MEVSPIGTYAQQANLIAPNMFGGIGANATKFAGPLNIVPAKNLDERQFCE